MPFKRLNLTSQLVSTNTLISTSNVTGAVILSGGMGVKGNIYADNIFLTGNLVAGTVNANTSKILTISTGLLGTSFNGGTPVTIAIDATVTTNTNSQNLFNKTVSSLGNSSTILDGSGGINAYRIGYKEIPPSGTTSTLILSDNGKYLYVGTNITVPPNSSVPFDLGTVITIVNSSGSSITITAGVGVTIRLSSTTYTGNRTLSGYGLCSLIKVGGDTWYISGSGVG